jgi:hypothetical protein
MSEACSPGRPLLKKGCLVIMLFVLIGCGPRLAHVKGKITVSGRAANSGRVFFRSADEKSVVVAYIGPDGAYQAVDVPVGPMSVWVTPLTRMERTKMQRSARSQKTKAQEESESPQAPTGSFVTIPEKYQDPTTSQLTTTVNSGVNTYNIELSSQ